MANKVTRVSPARLSQRIEDDVTSRAVRKLEDRITTLESQSTPLVNGTNTAGTIKGTLLAVRRLSGTGTYTPTAGTTQVVIRMIGGGGAGAGVTSGAGQVGAGGGGNSGWLLELAIAGAPIIGGAYSVGTGGPTTAGATGAAGGDTTISINGVIRTAKGGTGGAFLGAGAGNGIDGGPSAEATQPAVPGTVRQTLGRGGIAWVFGGAVGNGAGGEGGTTELGVGGAAVGRVVTSGLPGQGFGSGGSGGYCAGAASAANGAAGADGTIIIEEYA